MRVETDERRCFSANRHPEPEANSLVTPGPELAEDVEPAIESMDDAECE